MSNFECFVYLKGIGIGKKGNVRNLLELIKNTFKGCKIYTELFVDYYPIGDITNEAKVSCSYKGKIPDAVVWLSYEGEYVEPFGIHIQGENSVLLYSINTHGIFSYIGKYYEELQEEVQIGISHNANIEELIKKQGLCKEVCFYFIGRDFDRFLLEIFKQNKVEIIIIQSISAYSIYENQCLIVSSKFNNYKKYFKFKSYQGVNGIMFEIVNLRIDFPFLFHVKVPICFVNVDKKKLEKNLQLSQEIQREIEEMRKQISLEMEKKSFKMNEKEMTEFWKKHGVDYKSWKRKIEGE